MTIEDIQEAIDEMSTEELEQLLRDIRHNRTREDIIITKVKEKKDNVQKLLDQLTPEMAKALFDKLTK